MADLDKLTADVIKAREAEFEKHAGVGIVLLLAKDTVRDLSRALKRIAKLEAEQARGCPCKHTTPCDPDCTCVNPVSSRGCQRCCTYGSEEQQKARAEAIVGIEADLKEEHEHNERLEKKLKDWGAGCACGYDSEDDVCAVHHPRIQKAETAAKTLRSVIADYEVMESGVSAEIEAIEAQRDEALEVCRKFVCGYEEGVAKENSPSATIMISIDNLGVEYNAAKALIDKHEGKVKG